MMNDAAFQDIIQPYLNSFPARERFAVNDASIRVMVKEEATTLREYIKREVKGKLVSLKVDSSKKDGHPFFGVNIQFSNNGEIQLRTLAVRELFVSQSGENLKNEIITTLFLSPLTTVKTCCGLLILLRKDQEEQTVIDEEQEDLDLYVEQLGVKLDSVKCAAHTLQLAIVDDSIKKIASVSTLLAKCRVVVKKLRAETYRKKLKKVHLAIPVHDNDTRWNTSYAMLESLLKVRGYVEDDLEDFSADDWNEVESTLESLEPTMVATKILQGEQITLGDMYGTWLECKVKLKKVGSPLDNKICEAMTKRERREVYAPSNRLLAGQGKVPPLFDYPGFLAAIFLDPRYFAILDEDEIATAKAYIMQLWSKIEKNKTQEIRQNNLEEEGEEGEDDEDDEDAVSLMLLERDRVRSQNSTLPSTDISSKLNVYFRSTERVKDRKTSILKWWEDRKIAYPELYEVAKVVHAIPSTQVSVERLFSALRFIMHHLRSNLNGKMVEDLVLILNNSHLVNEDILVLIREAEDTDEDDEDDEVLEAETSESTSTSFSTINSNSSLTPSSD
ncbi:hypothetical protein FOCC_FOCC015268 [Frankliniella occidentalis]|nr:hypothetical protein FOCC_FOCC015268 [Frankliniella occidentalis]